MLLHRNINTEKVQKNNFARFKSGWFQYVGIILLETMKIVSSANVSL